MECSETVLEGLKVAASASVSDQLFTTLLSRTIQEDTVDVDESNSTSTCTVLNVTT